jgi:hypothetical protein
VFSDLRHSKAFAFFADRARYEKRSSTAKGLLLRVFFPPKVLKAKTPSEKYYKGIRDMNIQPEDDADRSQSYD